MNRFEISALKSALAASQTSEDLLAVFDANDALAELAQGVTPQDAPSFHRSAIIHAAYDNGLGRFSPAPAQRSIA